MATSKPGSNNSSRIILVVAGILMISSLGYFAIQYFTQREQIRENDDQLQGLRMEILELDDQILNFNVAMDAKDDELDQKNEQLIDAKENIERLTKKLEAEEAKLDQSSAEIRLMRKQLSNMEKVVKEYQEEITQLKEQNALLTEAVDSLKQNESDLQAENQALQTQTDRARAELEETKSLGSILKTKALVINAVKRNGKLVPGTKFKASQLKSMKVCFTILDNQVAESGPQSVFLVIENPDGSIQQNTDGGFSGTFRFKLRNKPYTAKKDLVYKKTSVDLCIDFQQPDKDAWPDGLYYLRLYTGDGNLIGQEQFEVK
ncbi:MAG: hypothetical protein AAFP89_10395 [Bacteroidota bacterium]